MFARLSQYSTALVTLLAISVVYKSLLTPLTEPAAMEQIEVAPRQPALPDRSLHSLFPEGAWQRGNCRQLQTKDMTLLFQQLEQQTDNRLRLSPVTVVVGHGISGDNEANPIIIEATEGAEITFSSALNLLGDSGGAPPIESGRIQGSVRIHRAGNNEDQPFEIKTSNVGIRNRKVWTTDAIDLKVGQARCLGSDLTIHLAVPAASGRGSGDALLDRIELIYLDQLTIPIPGDAAAPDETVDGGMLSIHCQGRLEYDFAIDQLELRDQVSFVREQGSLPNDEFRCDSLKVKFRDPTNPHIERAGPLDWLVEIVASGSPASVKSPRYDAELFADKIEFQAVKGLLQVHGKAGVQLRWHGITARLANLVYQFDAQNPTALGAIDVQGAGIVKIRDPKIPVQKMQWHDRFALFSTSSLTPGKPTPERLGSTTQTVPTPPSEVELQVDGEFQAWLSDGGEFKANSITAILKPASLPTDVKRTEANTQWVPDRLVGKGNVRINNSLLTAETEQLFVEILDEAAALGGPQSAAAPGASPLRNWVKEPSGDGPLTAPVARQRTIVRGDSIRTQLRRADDAQLSVKKLSVIGSVEAIHPLNSGGQVVPARVSGELFQLVDGGTDDVLEIVGGTQTPARFEFGDGFFVGPKIQIRPSANFVWINQAGEFRIPSAALPAGLNGPGDAPSDAQVRWTQPPHCRWQGEMRFDGRTVLLTGGVDITASLTNDGEPWEIAARGDRLQVDLVEGIQIGDVASMRSATVRAVSLIQAADQPVIVRAVGRAGDGVRQSQHVLEAKQLVFSPLSGGGFVGQGPGCYRAWLVPQSRSGLLASSEPTTNQSESTLTGVHLIYGESLRGDLTNRTLDFLQGVRAGIRPVAGWEDAFDAATMDALALEESTLDCDQLRLAIAPGYSPSPAAPSPAARSHISSLPLPWEVQAISGVLFRTRNQYGLIEATASRSAYTSSKQLFTAEGGPNRPAVVQQTRPDGSNGPVLKGRTISIHLGSMTIVDLVLENFTFPTQ
jgi:hypothetical protein